MLTLSTPLFSLSRSLRSYAIGERCQAPYEDGHWYNAKVRVAARLCGPALLSGSGTRPHRETLLTHAHTPLSQVVALAEDGYFVTYLGYGNTAQVRKASLLSCSLLCSPLLSSPLLSRGCGCCCCCSLLSSPLSPC